MTWNKGKTWEEQGIVGEKKAKRIAHLRNIASMGGKASSHNVKAVAQFDKDGNFITSYHSASGCWGVRRLCSRIGTTINRAT